MLDIIKSTPSNWSFHILLKDCNELQIFFEDSDYHRFLSILNTLSHSHDCPLHAYALLPDEIHLLMSRNSYTGIESVIGKLHSEYCCYFNKVHRRTFRILQLVNVSGAIPRHVDLLGYYRYIELVPVMSRVVDHPSEYPWSSYGSNAMGEDCGLISPHEVYLALAANEQERREYYRNGFEHITALSGVS